jgi:beta-1,4-mannosyl-glycoprotein beta-1,4-N-acetylglucosaminyltransferase
MIYDCFLFCHELEMLRLRIEELCDVVDRFVLVESTVTHSGKPKPLYFQNSSLALGRAADKLISIVVDDMPPHTDSWGRERHQRNAIARALTDAVDEDIVMISDVDEIPRAELVAAYCGAAGLLAFEQRMSYYWLNCCGGSRCGTRILPFRLFFELGGAEAIRHTNCPSIPNGGWHFSYIGGPQAVREKLESFSHTELDYNEFKSSSRLKFLHATGADICGRNDHRWTFVPLDESFPRCVREQEPLFRHLWADVMFNEDWYPSDQLAHLVGLCDQVRSLAGHVIEFGCWEGRSTVALARACEPETLIAVDNWEGNKAEAIDHPTVLIAQVRDVFSQFQRNVVGLTAGNVRAVRADCLDFLKHFREPIKFAHIDASHDYRSVERTLRLLRPLVVAGGILAGDDIMSANERRVDLEGGVERAVKEVLPGYVQAGNLWYWRAPDN